MESLEPPNQTIAREVLVSQYDDDDDAGVPYTRTSFGIPLYTYDDIPNFLKGNPYIVCGYRADIPTSLCIKR